MEIARVKLIESFKSIVPVVCKDNIDIILKERREKAIKWLETLSIDRLSEKEIDKAFDIAEGRI